MLHINRPSSTRFLARVRYPGCRRYMIVGKPTKSLAAATVRMARKFAEGKYKRGDVIMTADWYDPEVVITMMKR